MTFETIASMSEKSLRRTVFDIMVDNGMDEEIAGATVDSMTIMDLESYLLDCCITDDD
jgi:hypothetical protein